MALKNVESRLERLFDRTFAKGLRSHVQPIEIAQRIARELDLAARIGPSSTVAPNDIRVFLSAEDTPRFQGFEQSTIDELAASVRDHALQESYDFVGPVAVQIFEDTSLTMGQLGIRVNFVSGRPQPKLVSLTGGQYNLSERPQVIGRTAECDIMVADPNVSRRHAEIWSTPDGVGLRDLGSTNGTLVNGRRIETVLVTPHDEISFGSQVFRIELA